MKTSLILTASLALAYVTLPAAEASCSGLSNVGVACAGIHEECTGVLTMTGDCVGQCTGASGRCIGQGTYCTGALIGDTCVGQATWGGGCVGYNDNSAFWACIGLTPDECVGSYDYPGLCKGYNLRDECFSINRCLP